MVPELASTRTIEAPGASACAHSTSRASSWAQPTSTSGQRRGARLADDPQARRGGQVVRGVEDGELGLDIRVVVAVDDGDRLPRAVRGLAPERQPTRVHKRSRPAPASAPSRKQAALVEAFNRRVKSLAARPDHGAFSRCVRRVVESWRRNPESSREVHRDGGKYPVYVYPMNNAGTVKNRKSSCHVELIRPALVVAQSARRGSRRMSASAATPSGRSQVCSIT